jgi:hypothetical protein
MRDMMAQIRDVGDGIRGGTYTMTAPVITGGSITGVALSGNTLTNPVITGGSINNTTVGATTASTGAFTTLGATGVATFSAGTVSAPAITTTGDTNTGIFFPAADTIAFTEGGTEAMRIDSSGNVGIGTSSPASKLQVNNPESTIATRSVITVLDGAQSGSNVTALTKALAMRGAGGSEIAYIGYKHNEGFGGEGSLDLSVVGGLRPMTFATNSTERMRIDSSGNVGIGTSSPADKLDVVGNIRTTASGGNFYQLGADATGGYLYSSQSTAFLFYTGGAERMRIDSSGNLLVGTTNNPAKITTNGNIMINTGGYQSALGAGLTINGGGYNDTTTKARVNHIGGVGDNNNRCGWTAYSIKTNTVNNGAEYYIRPVIWDGSAFAEQGSAGVYLQDNATSWSSASDERLKENLEPIADAVIKVNSIRAVTGKYKTDTQGTSRAFLIAQDVQKVLPEAVSENSEGYLGLAYTDTIPLLVAAIQEQQTLINNLTTRLNALEGK